VNHIDTYHTTKNVASDKLTQNFASVTMAQESSVENEAMEAADPALLPSSSPLGLVSEMMSDVEIALELENRVAEYHEKMWYQKRVGQLQTAIDEYRALEKQRQVSSRQYADQFVVELASVSNQLGEFYQLREDHQALLAEHDHVLAQLAQLQETIAAGGSTLPTASVPASLNPVVAASEETAAPVAGQPAVESGKTGQELLPSIEEDGESSLVPPAAAAAAETTQDSSVAVVALDEDSNESKPTSLVDLETPIIMNIFSFLDALDILNTAQVNISMYSRVDHLFGLGDGGGGVGANAATSNDDTSTIATTETAFPPPSSPVPSSANTATTAASSGAGSSILQPTVAALPPLAQSSSAKPTPPPVTTAPSSAPKPPPVQPSSSTPTPAAPGATNDPFLGPGGLFSNLLRPRASNAAAGVAGGTTTPASGAGSTSMAKSPGRLLGGVAAGIAHRRTASSDAVGTAAQPMNAAMANSMAAKLSDGELNAIILMTERLKQKETLADSLVGENERLRGRLDGTEAVKEFLVKKVRDLEQALTKRDDHETRVTQQIASDQEVIAFLDLRVQELEGKLEASEAETARLNAELTEAKAVASKKAAVMGDMLRYEREKLTEQEREWKATRKLLVKEVKNCRAQSATLQAERDGFRHQNDSLRRAILGMPVAQHSTSMSSNGQSTPVHRGIPTTSNSSVKVYPVGLTSTSSFG
jgi:hypothetical protein